MCEWSASATPPVPWWWRRFPQDGRAGAQTAGGRPDATSNRARPSPTRSRSPAAPASGRTRWSGRAWSSPTASPRHRRRRRPGSPAPPLRRRLRDGRGSARPDRGVLRNEHHGAPRSVQRARSGNCGEGGATSRDIASRVEADRATEGVDYDLVSSAAASTTYGAASRTGCPRRSASRSTPGTSPPCWSN